MAEIGMQYPVWAEMVTESTYGTGMVIGKAVSANLSWQKEDNELRADDAVAFLGNEQVRSFLSEVRTAMTEKRALTGVGLTIPETMLGLVREETAAASKLLKFVNPRTFPSSTT